MYSATWHPNLTVFDYVLDFGACCILRKLDIFGDVLTHGYNWAKMRNKRKIQHAKDGTERGQKRPRPAGLALFGVQLISVFFSAKYASTLICVLPKPPTISTYKYPEAAVKGRVMQKGSRKDLGE